MHSRRQQKIPHTDKAAVGNQKTSHQESELVFAFNEGRADSQDDARNFYFVCGTKLCLLRVDGLAANLSGQELGFSLTKSGLWTAVTVLEMACGIWVYGQLADRIGRSPVFLFFQIGALIMVFLYSRITSAGMLLWVGAVMGMFVNGLNGGIGALMSEAYPTVARATAQNTLWNIGRAAGSLGQSP